MRGLIRALVFMIPSDSSVVQFLDPLGWAEDPIAEGNVKVGDLSIVLLVAIRGSFDNVLIMLNMVVEPVDLLLEVADFAGLLGVTPGNGCEEPLCDGSENVCVEFWVGCQGGCNGTRRHRWFRTLDQSNWERDAVFGGRGV